MLNAEQIPDEVWHTAMSTYHKTIRKNPGKAWQDAIAAAINAWPGGVHREGSKTLQVYIILPLPQEGK